jgi:CubicO group peptidase (beta-lactamase class C family)
MTDNEGCTRRDFLSVCGLTAGGVLVGCRPPREAIAMDAFIENKMKTTHIPGLAAAIIRDGRVAWSRGYGWADIERNVPMTADTLQNIGSISKTFVGSAVMQLWEQDALGLEDDVNQHLDFTVRNPVHAQTPISIADLMMHRSSIADGSAYAGGYACGDPKVPLGDWMRGYFTPGGQFYDAAENFHPWAPGDRFEYNNVAFGLLAYVVEAVSKAPFAGYCRKHLFEPLEMKQTSWYLADIDVNRHAIPYSYVSGGRVRGPSWGGAEQGVLGEGLGTPVRDGYAANCLYNHPNFPDGFLRTSLNQLARYALAYLNGGTFDGVRILGKDTVQKMLRPVFSVVDEYGEIQQGLVWYERVLVNGRRVWGHSGGDPGINTRLEFMPESGQGVIVFTNTWGAELSDVCDRLFDEIERA